jgi:uncharacterized protein YegJ (DUF2314 family)
MLWIALGAVAVAAGGTAFWWMRRRRRSRLISFVALLREPVSFDPAVVAHIAGKVWNADLGDGSSEGADGWVVGVDVMTSIFHKGRMVLINSFPRPYVDDPEQASENIGDLRLRGLFREHRAWFSCDAMGVDGRTPEHEVREWYRHLGPLFAALLDNNCLMIYLPDLQLAYPVNEDTEEALRSSDPIKALQETMTVPVVEVGADDPLLKEAEEQARREWPQFLDAYETGRGEEFAVKAPVSRGGNTEFIWIAVTAIEGDRIYGELANEPANLGSLTFGSKVVVDLTDLNDWCYINPEGELVGGFTVEAVQKASRRHRKG